MHGVFNVSDARGSSAARQGMTVSAGRCISVTYPTPEDGGLPSLTVQEGRLSGFPSGVARERR